MARYTGPVTRLARRADMQLELKGMRRERGKDSYDGKHKYPPGQHGQNRRAKLSTFALQLREKQRAKYYYGVLEKQFRITFKRAANLRGVTGHNLLILLERRLDNLVHRMGFAPTRPAARQLVNHGHVCVNGRRVNIASYSVNQGDVVSIREKSRELPLVVEGLEMHSSRPPLGWIQTDADKRESTLVSLPTREEIPFPIDEQMIVELYSK